jgi:TRAP-type mannitol/chloroaromatic compound transport system substrate-binding protein
MPLTNKDEYIVKEVLSRIFRAFTNLLDREDPQMQQVMNKCQEVLLEVIQKELTSEEQFHYIQSCKHTLEMSEERYNDLNKKIYSTLLEELEEMI